MKHRWNDSSKGSGDGDGAVMIIAIVIVMYRFPIVSSQLGRDCVMLRYCYVVLCFACLTDVVGMWMEAPNIYALSFSQIRDQLN